MLKLTNSNRSVSQLIAFAHSRTISLEELENKASMGRHNSSPKAVIGGYPLFKFIVELNIYPFHKAQYLDH